MLYDDSNGMMALHAKQRRREEERRDGGEKDGEENGDHDREKDYRGLFLIMFMSDSRVPAAGSPEPSGHARINQN